MYFKKKSYETDMEILVTEKNLVTFSGTVLASNVSQADENGRKYVKAGSFIDADGNIVTETGEPSSETLSSTPVGVLFETVDVTNGDAPCSLIVEGYLRKDRVVDGVFDNTLEEINAALPNIKFI